MQQSPVRAGQYWDREEEYMLVRRVVRQDPLEQVAADYHRTPTAIVRRIEVIFGVDSAHARYYRQFLDQGR